MQFDLTDREAAALINLLTGTIEGDQHPTSPRVETLRQIRAKLPGICIEPQGRCDLSALRHHSRHDRRPMTAARPGQRRGLDYPNGRERHDDDGRSSTRDPVKTDHRNIVQIAEGMSASASPSEIVSAILELRPSFALAELTELLDRAKRLQAKAEEFQRKAAILMDVVEQIANSSR